MMFDFSGKTIQGLVVCFISAVILTFNEIECLRTGNIYYFLMFLQFIHHFTKLVAFTSPLFITDKYLLTICAVGLTYVFIQNILSSDKQQPCILSIYVNKECGQKEDEYLRDIFYHLGFKNNENFTVLFNTFTLIVCIVLWYLILSR